MRENERPYTDICNEEHQAIDPHDMPWRNEHREKRSSLSNHEETKRRPKKGVTWKINFKHRPQKQTILQSDWMKIVELLQEPGDDLRDKIDYETTKHW